MPRSPTHALIVGTFLLFLTASAPASAQVGLQFEEQYPHVEFDRPLDMDVDANGRAYISTQAGKILTLPNDPSSEEKSLFLDLTDRVAYSEKNQEAGYMNTVLHPDFSQNGLFYVFYLSTGTTSEGVDTTHTVLARYRRSPTDPTSVEVDSRQLVLEIPKPTLGHNGGGLAFGPDGYLYVSVGDGSRGGDAYEQAQDRTTFLGTVLRIDVDGSTGNSNYAIPPSNPYVGNDQGFREEIFAYGFRNPWRMTIDPKTGDVWLGDVGEHGWEEINVVEKGENYGWPIKEGPNCFEAETCSESELTDPIHAYRYGSSYGRCVTGGYVYRGSDIPSLQGKYVFGDWATERMWVLTYEEGEDTTVTEVSIPNEISKHYPSFAVDDEGELYFLSLFHKIIYKFRPGRTAIPPTDPDTTKAVDASFEISGPNPAVTGTSVTFRVSEVGPVKIALYDLLGREVAALFDRTVPAGTQRSIRVPVRELAAGMYLIRMRFPGFTRTRTIRIVR